MVRGESKQACDAPLMDQVRSTTLSVTEYYRDRAVMG
jgi:hypothetical protein